MSHSSILAMSRVAARRPAPGRTGRNPERKHEQLARADVPDAAREAGRRNAVMEAAYSGEIAAVEHALGTGQHDAQALTPTQHILLDKDRRDGRVGRWDIEVADGDRRRTDAGQLQLFVKQREVQVVAQLVRAGRRGAAIRGGIQVVILPEDHERRRVERQTAAGERLAALSGRIHGGDPADSLVLQDRTTSAVETIMLGRAELLSLRA